MCRRHGASLLFALSCLAIPASATTTLDTFSDARCQSLVGTAYTVDGGTGCQQLPGVKSVNTTSADEYCAGQTHREFRVYHSPGNNATLAPVDSCIANSSINSLSVDCKLPDGSWEPANPSQMTSFSLAGASSVQAPASVLSSSSPSPLPSSPTSVSSILPASASSSTTSPTAKISLGSSSSTHSTTSTPSLSPIQPITAPSASSSTSTLTSLMSPITSPTSSSTAVLPSASSTAATDQGGGSVNDNGTLSTSAQIAIGVVVPMVGVIVAVVFGVRMWNRK